MLGKKKTLSENLRGDKWIWVLMGLLAICSLCAVFSSAGMSYMSGEVRSVFSLLGKQFAYLTGAIFLAYYVHTIHYMKFALYAPLALLLTALLLAFTLKWGVEINGARRWIRLPFIGTTIQSSDVAKLVLIIYLARMISLKQEVIKSFKGGFLRLMIPIFTICGLIAPANLSTALLLFGISMMMLFIGRVRKRHLALVVLAGVLCGGLIYVVGKTFPNVTRLETWTNRIENFRTGGGDQYHVKLQKIAIAEGGWFGVGPGKSFQKNRVPFAYADSIYAIIIEEYGLVGGFFVLGLYLMLFIRCVVIVSSSPKTFGALVVIGVTLNIVITAFANMAVAVNLIPVTGQTLPMISMGGTSLMFTGISFGILQSVSKFIQVTEEDIIEEEVQFLEQPEMRGV